MAIFPEGISSLSWEDQNIKFLKKKEETKQTVTYVCLPPPSKW